MPTSFDKQYEKALAAAAGKSSTGYYEAQLGSDGLYEIYAADPNAKQLFFGWASGDAKGAWRYGRDAKNIVKTVKGFRSHRNPDYSLWVWACTKTDAAALLRDLKSQPPEPAEKAAYKELVALLTKISQGKPLSTIKKSGKNLDTEIVEGMARLAWANAWGNEQEEKGESVSGVDIYDAAPPTPKRAKDWAKALGAKVIRANGFKSLTTLYNEAQAAGFPNDAESFGSDLAGQAIGIGTDWTDRVRGGTNRDIIKVPHDEFYI